MVTKRARQIINSIKPNLTKTPQGDTKLGSVGYDNIREDIEKTKSLREGSIQKVPINNNDITNKEYVDNKFPVTHASTTGQTANDHHNELHTIASHSDTSATGTELNTLTDNSIVNDLHRHSELVASDGSPDPALSVDASGNVGIGTTSPSAKLEVNGIIQNSNGIVTSWRSTRSDPTALKWYKIGRLSITATYGGYSGTFISNARSITSGEECSVIFKLVAKQIDMSGSPSINLDHFSSVANTEHSVDVKAILITDTADLKEINLYVGNMNENYLYYNHAVLSQNRDLGSASFVITEGDTGVVVGDLPAGTQIDMIKGITTLNDGKVGIGTTSPSEKLDVNSDAIRIRTSQTPASATATGDAGMICWDADYIYVCTATNTWKRTAIATW